MSVKPYHVGKNGPGLCGARKRRCPLGHFETFEEAENAYAQNMRDEGFEVSVTITKRGNRKYELVSDEPHERAHYDEAELAALREAIESSPVNRFSVQELQALGESLEKQLWARAGYNEGDLTKESLGKLARETSSYLEALGGDTQSLSEVSGPLKSELHEAVSVLPSGARAYVTGPVLTKVVHGNRKNFDGLWENGVVSTRHNASTIHRSRLPENASVGDYLINHERVGFAGDVLPQAEEGKVVWLSRIERLPGQALRAGENITSLLNAAYVTPRKLKELKSARVISAEGELLPDQEEKLHALVPDLRETMEASAVVRPYQLNRSSSRKKAMFEAELIPVESEEPLIIEGRELKGVPLFEEHQSWVDMEGHTISAKKGTHQSALLAHEFTHAIQSTVPGGIPGERELFREVSEENGDPIDNGYYRYYEGFPLNYMGDEGGREVFTTATESLFYPHKGRTYLYETHENAERVRHWALGAWAVLAVHGNKAAREA